MGEVDEPKRERRGGMDFTDIAETLGAGATIVAGIEAFRDHNPITGLGYLAIAGFLVVDLYERRNWRKP